MAFAYNVSTHGISYRMDNALAMQFLIVLIVLLLKFVQNAQELNYLMQMLVQMNVLILAQLIHILLMDNVI